MMIRSVKCWGAIAAIIAYCGSTSDLQAQAATGCVLSLESLATSLDLSNVYLPAASSSSASSAGRSSTRVPLSVKVKNTGTASCSFVLAVPAPTTGTRYLTSPGLPASSDNKIPYALYDHSNKEITGDVSTGIASVTSTASVVSGTVAANSETTVDLSVVLTSLGLVAYSETAYTDTATLSLYNDVSGTYTKVSDTSQSFGVTVKPQICMAFASVGSPALYTEVSPLYEVNFGELKAGDEKSMQVSLETNNGYQINFVSENKGHLICKAHDKEADATLKSVPYEMSVSSGGSNVPYDFATASASSFPTNIPTYPLGTLIQDPDPRAILTLKFKMGDPSKALAGDYQDVVHVTLRNPL
jgi:hypothetical protein